MPAVFTNRLRRQEARNEENPTHAGWLAGTRRGPAHSDDGVLPERIGPLASPDEPHGVLVAAAPPAGLQPIAIAYIDDRKVGGKPAYWVKPGMRRIQSRLLSGDFAYTLKSSGETGQKQGELMLDVEAGYRYLLVGEVTARREWRVFVLRKEPLQDAPTGDK